MTNAEDRAVETPSASDAVVTRPRRRRRRRDRRGVALVMVLGAITVLTVFLTELQEETSAELSAALAERDALRAEYYARSGVSMARLLMASEPSIRTAITPIFMALFKGSAPQIPVWNFSDMVLAPFNEQLAGAPAAGGPSGLDFSTGKNLGLTGGGHFELKIVDEESKINVNLASNGNIDVVSQLVLARQIGGLIGPPQYDPLFEGRDADNQFSDRAAICGALVDWADEDDQAFDCNTSNNAGPSTQGVEDNFYQTIGLPYLRKNAAYDSVDELRLVRGMGDDFWATFVDPDPGDPSKRTLTVWGKRKATVNVNTANAQTIWAVVCGSAAQDAPLCTNPEQAASFLAGVTLVKAITQGAPLFGAPKDFLAAMQGKGLIGPMLSAIGVEPIKLNSSQRKEFLKSLSVESKFLSIYSDGVVPGNKRETRVRIHAVVDFSGAKPPEDATQLLEQRTTTGGSTAGDAQGMAIEDGVKSNPAGAVVYYRVE